MVELRHTADCQLASCRVGFSVGCKSKWWPCGGLGAYRRQRPCHCQRRWEQQIEQEQRAIAGDAARACGDLTNVPSSLLPWSLSYAWCWCGTESRRSTCSALPQNKGSNTSYAGTVSQRSGEDAVVPHPPLNRFSRAAMTFVHAALHPQRRVGRVQ